MTVQVQTATIDVNQTVNFAFTQAIGGYIVGLSHFGFQFPNFDAHKVLEIALSLASNMPSNTTVNVTVNGTMKDHSGNNLDPASTATVMVLTWSQGDEFATVSGATGIVNGTASAPILLSTAPGSATYASQSVLTGFDVLSGDGNDHNIQSIQAQVSSHLYTQPPSATIASVVSMQDASGHVAVDPTVDGAWFLVYNDPEIEVVTWAGPGAPGLSPNDWATVTVPFTQPATAAALFLTGFNISYPDGVDHWLASLVAGCPAVTLADGGSHATFYPYAAIMDGDVQTSKCNVAYGNVGFAVVGIL